MRIAFLSDTMGATSDSISGHGLGRANHTIATGLLNRGHEVTLFGAPGSQFAGRTIVCDGEGQKYEPQLAKAAYHMRDEFDVYIDAGHKHALGMLFADLPVINIYHDRWQPYSRNAVLVSEGLRTLLPPEFKSAKVVHNQIDPTYFVPSYRADDDPAYAMFLGFVYQWKSPILAIEAAARARLKLFMGGSFQENTNGLWHEGENSRLMGAIPPYTRNEMLRGAQVYLQLGHSEAFGLTTVEAGLCGTPTVAWPTGGNLDTICDGVNGVFIDPRNPDRVEAVCLAIQQAKVLNRRIVREYTLQKFGCPERQAQEYEALLEAVIGALDGRPYTLVSDLLNPV